MRLNKIQRSSKRPVMIIGLLCVFAMLTFLLNGSTENREEVAIERLKKLGLDHHFEDHSHEGCTFPEMDPQDQMFLDFLADKVKGLTVACDWTQHPHSLEVNLTQWTSNEPGIKGRTLQIHPGAPCDSVQWQGIEHGSSDRSPPILVGGGTITRTAPVKIEKYDFVVTSCTSGKGKDEQKNVNVMYQVYPNDDLIRRATENAQQRMLLTNAKQKPLNIILLGFDSTSRTNVYRYMPKTLEWMHKNFGWATDLNQIEDNTLDNMVFEMKGKTIVGDGTTPQLTALLTGYPTSHYYTGDGSGKIVDGWEFIFKDYVKNGYITSFLEDQPSLGAFSLRLSGWRKQPVDHYMRPYWLMVKRYDKDYEYTECLIPNRGLNHKAHFNYVAEFMDAYPDNNRMIFAFSKLAHSHPTNLRHADEDLMNLLQQLKDRGHLENSALLMFGDHGHRFGTHRLSVQGKLEERLPLDWLVLPQWFIKQNLKQAYSLAMNQNKLISHFDTHATLKHLLQVPFSAPFQNNRTIGRSLFEPIPSDRTCGDAGIADQWCVCLKWQEIDTNTPIVQNGTLALLADINKMLADDPDAKCVYPLHLKQIRRAEVMKLGDNVKANITKGNRDTYQVQFELTPGGGIFEASFEVVAITNTTNVIQTKPHFSRGNEYGHQVCQPKPYLRIYCLCKEQQ